MATNFKLVQAQPFTLSGSGAISGATTIVLTSFTQIDGTLLTMTNFGSKGFMTMEPGNSTLEEQISFTGVTQNANGTATLSGIKTVLMISPYTEASGLAQTHAGSTTVVLSNTAGFYDQFLAKDDDATISQTYTFTVPNYPQVDNSATMPTLQAQLATKAYVDSVVIVGAPDATTAVKGIVQIPTQAQVDAGTATGSTAASLSVTPNLVRSRLLSDYAADSGVADAYVIAPTPAVTALVGGTRVSFKVGNTNTTTSTVVVNALSATAIFKNNGSTALVAGDLAAGQVVELEHNGVNGFMLMTPPIKGLVPAQAGSAGTFLTTNGTTASWGYPYDYQAFTGNGTWTKPSNLVGTELVHIQVWGAGGGGGSVDGNSLGQDSGGAGGGGGAYAEAIVRVSALGATESVTIGTAGTGGSAGVNNGTAGGNTTFGTLVTGYGGGGGVADNGPIPANAGGGGGGGLIAAGATGTTSGGAGGGYGGASNADAITSDGGGGGGNTGAVGKVGYRGGGGGGGSSRSDGSPTAYVGGASTFGGGGGGGGKTGAGGVSIFGGSGGAAGAASNGVAGSAPGGGGGGGSSNDDSNFAGGNGARGECRVWVIK